MIIAADIGIKGALAFMEGQNLTVCDIPTLTTNGKTTVDIYQLSNIIFKQPFVEHAYIEQVAARPGQGVVSMFSFGKTYGIILGILAAKGIPITYVTPGKWKKDLGVQADKDAARARASELMPQHAHLWPLKKHDGRAEAALIAYWGSRK